jgi:methionyl-tRNA formyltransferase
MDKLTWAFFGTSNFSILVLNELKKAGFLPSLIVTVPDKPKGRKMIMTAPEVKTWADNEKIACIQPKSLRDENIISEIKSHSSAQYDFFVVASYGKIIPKAVLDIPKKGTLNVHPSLLPKLRGASPLQNSILTENETGVTIIRLDEEMDHGPIVAQEKILSWQDTDLPYEEELEDLLGKEGGKMLAKIIPDWLSGKTVEKDQEQGLATFCGKIEKEDGKLDLSGDPVKNLRKIRAFHKWPVAFYFTEHKGKPLRVLVKSARLEGDQLVIERVIPEGKKEMPYNDFLKGLK